MLDLIVLGFVVAFASVATLGHILLALAFLAPRKDVPQASAKRVATDEHSAQPELRQAA